MRRLRTWQDDDETVDTEAEAGSARDPNAVPERVESRKALVSGLLLPAVHKQ